MLSTKLKEAAGNSADATLYVDDVFSNYLYTGNNSTQTITNGIDLAGKGGMVWTKVRSTIDDHELIDTVRGRAFSVESNTTDAQSASSVGTSLTQFNSNGYSLGTNGNANVNENAQTFASWTFRKAAKFFDVVTYTGNGTSQTIPHSLGVAPGMIFVKCTSTTGNWQVYSRGMTSADYAMILNSTSAQFIDGSSWNSTAPTSSVFTVGSSPSVNDSGQTYVAYLFAHDTDADGIIQCGSFHTTTTAPEVNLGWEPQYILIKSATFVNDWYIFDSMRGLTVGSTDAALRPSLSASEVNFDFIKPTATGFQLLDWVIDQDYIYMAIRRPNKPPTTGTQVYNAVENTASGAISNNGFPVDLSILTNRAGNSRYFYDRMRGNVYLTSETTNAEASTSTYLKLDNMIGVNNVGWLSSPNIFYGFKRAPGFFDVVCYTGDGSLSRSITTALDIGPSGESFVIIKSRSNAVRWSTTSPLGNKLVLNTNGSNNSSGGWPSAAYNRQLDLNGYSYNNGVADVNASGQTYVAYIFSTCAGVSKTGYYIGNGTGQAIACGFSAGARFVLIKRADSTGDWYTFDSARGLTSGSSPYLLLNSTAAEVTGNNGVYASTGGFTLGSTASTTTNINAAIYIFLAVA